MHLTICEYNIYIKVGAAFTGIVSVVLRCIIFQQAPPKKNKKKSTILFTLILSLRGNMLGL